MGVSRQSRWAAQIGMACALWIGGGLAQARAQEVTLDVAKMGSLDGGVAQSLKDAGYELNESSLIRALLTHPREGIGFSIPVAAATFLSWFPRSDRILEALLSTAGDPVDSIAVNAMRSLHRLGDTQWHDLALGRLPLAEPMYQVELATLLGQAGRADGWPVMLRAVRENVRGPRSLALRDMGDFDGVLNLDGLPIDVVAELEALRLEVPEAAAEITEAIERIRERRDPPRPRGPAAVVGVFGMQALAEAGYQPEDAASLILALNQAEPPVRETAARALAAFPGDQAVVGALHGAAQSGEDPVAVRAMESLQILGATGWEDAAAARLAVMAGERRQGHITLARILAQAGRADGWPVITRALTPGSDLFLPALVEVPYFDGLTDAEGRVIDAAAVLRPLRALDPQGDGALSRFLDQALQQVELKRSGRDR